MDSLDLQQVLTSSAAVALKEEGQFDVKAHPSTFTSIPSSIQGLGPRYCYRHRPDLVSQRLTDEEHMKGLETELETLPQNSQRVIDAIWSTFSTASERHRRIILDGILTKCCFSQLSYVSAAVKRLIRIDFVVALPREISFQILEYLDAANLCRAAQVSRLWHQLADDDIVWHRMCEQHIDKKCSKCGWGLPLVQPHMLQSPKAPLGHPSDQDRQQSSSKLSSMLDADHGSVPPDENSSPDCPPRKRRRLHGTSNVNTSYNPPQTRPWKDVYKERFMIGLNWKHGRYKTKVFECHTDSIMCLQFDNTILATGSYDTTIRLWDVETATLLRTLRGHTSGVRALQFDDTKLVSGGLDHTIKIWNWRTGQCVRTIAAHDGSVIGLHFVGNVVASGSSDKAIKVWDFDDREMFTLRGHKDWVNAVKIDHMSRTLLSASDDFTLRLWDLNTQQCIRTFEGHCGQVQQVLFLPSELECDEHLQSSRFVSAPKATKKTSATADASLHSTRSSFGDGFSTLPDRVLPPRYMLSGGLDNTLRLWDTTSGECLRVFFGHVEGVWALAADRLRIVSGAGDSMTKVWDLATGACEKTFTGHTGPVTCIGLSDSMMCTGGDDGQARLFNFKTGIDEEPEKVE
ncbi:WD40 repeat-like protein [Byssothecium circinans]|uniref:WD40 repeat-like protein n=1 Tax=Byssothecium circinans TaxID=147558 RepID=A0A6A5TE58_9PLEO|nr:WD40 repeat-like protein [Byssothecium circinans]